MHKRLYCMLPDVECCKQLVDELKQTGIREQHIFVIASHDAPLEGLQKASVLQKTELLYGIELGMGIGGIAGMIAGLLAIAFPPAGVVLGGGAAILGTTLAGASFGSLVSAAIARDIPNHELKEFQTALSLGQILLVMEVSPERVEEIKELITTTLSEINTGMVKHHNLFEKYSSAA